MPRMRGATFFLLNLVLVAHSRGEHERHARNRRGIIPIYGCAEHGPSTHPARRLVRRLEPIWSSTHALDLLTDWPLSRSPSRMQMPCERDATGSLRVIMERKEISLSVPGDFRGQTTVCHGLLATETRNSLGSRRLSHSRARPRSPLCCPRE